MKPGPNEIELHMVSDGTAPGTFIRDQDGRQLVNVSAIRWTLKDCNSLAVCELVLDCILFKFDVKLPADQFILKPYGQWRRLKEYVRRKRAYWQLMRHEKEARERLRKARTTP